MLAMIVSAAPVRAADTPLTTTLGSLSISDPWARASAGMARAGAAFMSVANSGAADRLISADADISDVVELHTHIKDGDVMRMRKVDAIDITDRTTTKLQPGGLHVMFIGLHEPLKEGETFPLSLTFEHAGTVEVTVSVRGVASMGPMGTVPGMTHGHGATKN